MSTRQFNFEEDFAPCYDRVKRYLSLKSDWQIAEELTQIVFVKAFEKIDSFNGDSSPFTWLCSIANNELKNEYRRKHKHEQIFIQAERIESHYMSIEFTTNVEIRIDITRALKCLKQIDREIITLHYDLGCTLQEVADLIGKRLSTTKNRLYRALERLRVEMRTNEEVRNMISIIDQINFISKDVPQADNHIYEDIISHLKLHIEEICSLVGHKPTNKLTFEIYPDLKSFHQAVDKPDAPNWFMGTIEGNVIKIVSPINPGPEHTYDSILKSTVHLFTMWLVKDINPTVPIWLYQGIGGYLAQLMTGEYVKQSITDFVHNGHIPTLDELEDKTWAFDTKKGFQFSYTLAEFILNQYGADALKKIIRKPNDFNDAFNQSSDQFVSLWTEALVKKCS